MELQDQPTAEVKNTAAETPVTDAKPRVAPLDKQQIVNAVKEISEKDAAEISREEVIHLRVQFYNIRHGEVAKEKADFLAVEENAEEAFTPSADPLEEELKAALQVVKDKKAALLAEQTAQKLDNLLKKNNIIEEIITAGVNADDAHLHLDKVRELQRQFKEIGDVPDTDQSAVWKNYQSATEAYYDQLQVNRDLRDLDFKKNLEIKTLLIEEARKLLAEEQDVVSAFRHTQSLQQKWREIGPVAKELRDSIWNQFREITAEVYKRYQEHFENRKAEEKANEEAKLSLVEQLEAIDINALTGNAMWESATKQIVAAQEQWKQIGFASRKANAELFRRFRTAADSFFAAKSQHFRQVRDTLAENLAKKIAICEEAEEIKDSTDWQRTSQRLLQLQADWKKIGAVAKKDSDAVWERFRAACDHFFNGKKAAESDVREAERANLKAKREIVQQLKEIDPAHGTADELAAKVRSLMNDYQAVGHVPFRDKDKLHEAYRAEVSRLYEALDMGHRRASRQAFESNIESLQGNDRELQRQREKLQRSVEMKKNEIKTFENNLGFLKSASKSASPILRDMEQRVERLRGELAELQSKLQLVVSKING